MAAKKFIRPQVDVGFNRMMKEKNRRLNMELKDKLRKPLTNPDTQRIANIFLGSDIFDSMFHKDRGRYKIGKSNKKGSVFDILFISFWFFFAAVVLFIVILIWNEFNSGITWGSTTGQEVADIFDERIKPQYDFMLLGIYMGAIIITFILAYLIKMHRIFIVIAFIFSVATYIVSAVLSNVFEKMISTGKLAETAVEFPITVFIIDKFPVFYIVFAILVIFVMSISEQVG